MTDCWLKTLWKYCREQDIQITDQMPHLSLARKGDRYLMEAFANANNRGQPKYDEKTLKLLNECRCFLKVVSLADISTADGA